MRLNRKLYGVVVGLLLSGCGSEGGGAIPLTTDGVTKLNAHLNEIEFASAFEPCRNSQAKKEFESLKIKYSSDYFFDWFKNGEVLPEFKHSLDEYNLQLDQLTKTIEVEKSACMLSASKVISNTFAASGYDFDLSVKNVFHSLPNYISAQQLGIVDSMLPVLTLMKTQEGEKELISNKIVSPETIKYVAVQTEIINAQASMKK